MSYEIIRLCNGAFSLRSLEYNETMHPAIGPLAEADVLYVRQLRIAERAAKHNGHFVVWDVGLGAAANAIAVLQALAPLNTQLTLLSFDATIEPLRFG
ncbi:MAG TPA: methyltransferase, partial [Candidatus Eisenbacteria bacterium]|nr:methyltransferase [Candidatus Eisenbacteria bacterium]